MARAIKTRSSGRGSSPRSAKQPGTRETPGWTIRRARGLQIVESRALAKLGWLAHGFSTRPGGESTLEGKRVLNLGFTDWDARERVAANRANFAAALAASEMVPITLRQFHSDVIHVPAAATAEAPRSAPCGRVGNAHRGASARRSDG